MPRVFSGFRGRTRTDPPVPRRQFVREYSGTATAVNDEQARTSQIAHSVPRR